MCGHIGMATLAKCTSLDQDKFFEQGLYVDALRGYDATGIALVDMEHPKEVNIYKRAIPAADFVNTRKYNKLMRAAGTSVFIGHNRAATVGRIIDETSHPYQHGPITLAHNGTLNYNTNLDGDFDVDSEEICYTMATTDEKSTLERISGAYALVWYNADKKTLNFARNSERPFAFAFSEDKKTIYWASEMSMLTWLLERNKLKTSQVYELSSGYWLSFAMAGAEFPVKVKDMDVTEFEVYRAKKPVSGVSGAGGANIHTTVRNTALDTLKKYGVGLGDLLAIKLNLKDDIRYNSIGTADLAGKTFWTYTHGNKVLNANAYIYGVGRDVVSTLRESYGEDANIIVFAELCGASENWLNGTLHFRTYFKKETLFDLETLEEYKDNPSLNSVIKAVDTNTSEDSDDLSEGSVELFVGPHGRLVNRETMEAALKDGCSSCGIDLSPDDVDDVYTFDEANPICFNCLDAMTRGGLVQ